MVHRRTTKGLTGFGGGRWGTVPQPPGWYATSTQLCGINPFSAGTSRPNVGAPLGRDMNTGTLVAGDPQTWHRGGLVSSASMMLFGLNGFGKSSFGQRLMYASAARGAPPAVFDPIKNEHAGAVAAMGGNVISIGPDSTDQINLLDLGALGDAAARIGGSVGEGMRRQAISKAVDLVTLVVQISRGEPLSDSEAAALDELVRATIELVDLPWMGDLVTMVSDPPARVLAATACLDLTEFAHDFKRLRRSLLALMSGEMGALVGGRASVRVELANPGGFCFDTSSIPASNSKLLSAAMLCTWNIGFAAMDAHWEMSRHNPEEIGWGGYFAMQDEFWYPMRAAEGIIDRADRLGRTNRGEGVTELKITHSPKDFLSLPNAHDREKAKGLTERSGVLGLMALSRKDLNDLCEVQPLNAREIDTVAGFNSPPSWKPEIRKDGQPAPPPGAGKILLKIPNRVGIAVKMTLTAGERKRHVTDERSRSQQQQGNVREASS